MLSQSRVSTQVIQNVVTGEIAPLYRLVKSPYTFEAMDGVYRAQVWTSIPGASGAFQGWDYWLPKDCVFLPNAPISQGVTVGLIDNNGQVETAQVIATSFDQICVSFEDGQISWVNLPHVVAVVPLTNSALAITA